MAVTVAEEGTDTTATDGTEQTLFTEEDGGVFQFIADIDDAAAGDYLEVREYVSAQAASTMRQLGSTITMRWDSPTLELQPRAVAAGSSYRVTVKRVAGADFDVVWALKEVG